MLGRLNHVGVATPDMEAARALHRDLYGADSTEPRALPEQGVWVSFVSLPNTEIELIAPYGEASPLTAFLAKSPRGGQHHVCFEVDDLAAARDELISRGARVLGSGEPRIGAHGEPVLFLDPRTSGGVLVELMQAPRAAH